MKLTNSFAQYHSNPIVLLEGGAYGHMSHIHEDMKLSFYDLKDMVGRLLQGHIKSIKEKVDGQALAVSIDDEGKVIFARSKGHLRDFGHNALDYKGVCKQFEGRGDLSDAFCMAATDIAGALSKIPSKVQDMRFGTYDARVPKLTNNGKKVVMDDQGDAVMETKRIKRWLNFEIIWPETTNVVPYNHRLIILHNYDAFDEDGRKRDSDFNEFAENIKQDLEQVNANIQKQFKISTVPMMNLPKVKNFEEQRDQFLFKITSMQSEAQMSDSNTLGDYYEMRMRNTITQAANTIGFNIEEDLINMLVSRWIHGTKTPNIRDIMKMIKNSPQEYDGADKFQQWVKTTDKRDMLSNILSDIKNPVKDLVTDLGITLMNNMKEFLTLNPSEASIEMRHALEKVLQQVEATNDLEVTKKIDGYLAAIHRAGGLDGIVPSEGFTFTYKPENSETHSVYKLTGAFADINQIIGFFKYARS